MKSAGRISASHATHVKPVDTYALGINQASGAGAEYRSAQAVSRIMLVAYQKGNIVVEGRGSQTGKILLEIAVDLILMALAVLEVPA